MADENEEVDEQMSPLMKLKATQNKERKELQAKITAMKHSLTKNDKKKKKEVTQQVEELEADLKRRHEQEMRQLTDSIEQMAVEEDVSAEKSSVETTTPEVTVKAGENGGNQAEAVTGKKKDKTTSPFKFKEVQLTKAQQKKQAKQKKQAEDRAAAVARDEKSAKTSAKSRESQALQQALAERGYQIFEVASDGDCLYSAVAHQCRLWGVSQQSASELRHVAARHIKRHKEDFLPFLPNKAGDQLEEEQFEDYCERVAKSCSDGGDWGGETELRAISTALLRRIEVLHGNGHINTFGEEFGGEPLLLTYHKHAYALGEHYNSTMPKQEEEEDEEEGDED